MLTAQHLAILRVLLNRVQLTGQEAPVFVELVTALAAYEQRLTAPAPAPPPA